MQYTRATRQVIFFTLIISSNGLFCFANAASQGELGERSTASIEISVHVNQTLTSIHPEQLLVNSTTPITMHDSQPFCIVNQGYGLEASVPYDLKVDALNIQTINGAPAYTIYI